MAYDEKMASRIRGALAGAGPFEEKKMFRGLTLMVNGKMCVSVGAREIMCRVDPAQHGDLLKRDGSRTVVMNGREYIGWLFVRQDALRRKKDFDFWTGLALDFNQRAKLARRRKQFA